MLKELTFIGLTVGVSVNSHSASLLSKTDFVLVSQDVHLMTKQPRTNFYVDFSSISPDIQNKTYQSMKVGYKFFSDFPLRKGKDVLSAVEVWQLDCIAGKYRAVELEAYSTEIAHQSSLIEKQGRQVYGDGSFQPQFQHPQSTPYISLVNVGCGKLKRKDFN